MQNHCEILSYRWSIVLLFLAFGATTSRGEDDGGDTIVVTGTRAPRALKESVVPVQVIGRDEIERAGDATAADSVARTSGVIVLPDVRGSGASIQGLSSKHVLVLVNGRRMAGRVTSGDDLERIPADQIERIEIVKGASSVLYGSDAIGGVINVITRPPRRGIAARVRTSHDSLQRNEGAAAIDVGNAAARGQLQATRRVGAPYRLEGGDGPSTAGSGYDARSLRLDVEAEASPAWRIGGAYGYESQRTRAVSATGGGAVLDVGGRTETQTVSLTPQVELSSHEQLRFDVRGSRLVDFYDVDQRRADALDRHERSSERLTEGGLTYSNAFNERHELVAGVEGLNQRYGSDRLGAGEEKRDRTSAFAQDEWRPGEARRLYVVPGVRVDHDSQFDENVAKNLALRYDLTPALVARASYGEGYRAPSFTELYLDFQNPGVGYEVIGNPDLRPERSQSVQASLAYAFSSATWLSLGAFDNRIRDLITTAARAQTGDKLTFAYVNAERARTRGFELAAHARADGGLEAGVAYTFLRARDLTQDRALADRPQHSGSVLAGYEHRGAGFATTATMTVVGKRPEYVEVGDADETHAAAGYRRLDLHARQRVGADVELLATGRNLTDEHQASFNPAAPRSYEIGLGAHF
jgi:outer membrane receptor for ferrienterochelin and colicins